MKWLESKLGRRALSGVLVFIMLATAVAPLAVAVTRDENQAPVVYICGKEEHEHDDSCHAPQGRTYACESEFGDMADRVVHTHDDACYDPVTGELACYLSENTYHEHGPDCYAPVEPVATEPVTTVPGQDTIFDDEPQENSHYDTQVQAPESQAPVLDWSDPDDTGDIGGTVFDDFEADAPMAAGELTCDVQETLDWPAHQHDETCVVDIMSETFTCNKEEHVHDEGCVAATVSDDEIDDFIARVDDLIARMQDGEFDEDLDGFNAEYEELKAMLDGMLFMTQEQQARISMAAQQLENLYEAMNPTVLSGEQVTGRIAIRPQVIGTAQAKAFVYEIKPPEDAQGWSVDDGFERVITTAFESASGEIVFTEPGVYEFDITCADSDADYNLDDRTWTAEFTVRAAQDGTLSLAQSWLVDGVSQSDCNAAEFVHAFRGFATWSPEAQVKAQKALDGMTLEEKLGQMFLVQFESQSVEQINNMTAAYKPGGYIVFQSTFTNAGTSAEFRQRIESVQAASRLPLVISVDEEGGKVNRVSNLPAYRDTAFGYPQDIAKGGAQAVEQDASVKARFLADLGINLNHAPVADVADSGYIYARTYGGDGLYNAKLVAAAVRGHERNGVGSTMKHFPGYGSTSSDTHAGFAVNHLTFDELRYNDFLPFYAGMGAGGKAVMVTHNIYEAIDPDSPASMSSKVYDMLRNYFGYDGLAITDGLGMKAAEDFSGKDNQALYALRAGADMALVTYETMPAQYSKVLAAVRSGEIPESQVNRSALRVLSWKAEMGLLDDMTGDVGDAEASWMADGKLESGSFPDMWDKAMASGGTVTILKSVNLDDGLKMDTSRTVTLNLNGKTLHFSSGTYGIDQTGGVLSITDNSVVPAKREIDAYGTGWDDAGKTLRWRETDLNGTEHTYELDLSGVGAITGELMGRVIRSEYGTCNLINGRVTGPNGGVETVNGIFEQHGGYIVGCEADNGAGVLLSGPGTCVLNSGYIGGNTARGNGGGAYWPSGKAIIKGGTVCANTATNGGGIYVASGTSLNTTDGSIACNTASMSGGGMYFESGKSLGSIIISKNTAMNGGGVCMAANMSLESGTCLLDNIATQNGGGIYVGPEAGQITLRGVKAYYNQAQNGGGAYLSGFGNVRHVVQDTDLMCNSAVNGGGLYLAENAVADLTNGMQIKYNQAEYAGGGVYLNSDASGLGLVNTSLAGNSASIGGGVAYLAGRITLANSVQVQDNSNIYLYHGETGDPAGWAAKPVSDLQANNLYVSAGNRVHIKDQLATNSLICVTPEAYPEGEEHVIVASREDAELDCKGFAGFFKADNPDYLVGAYEMDLILGTREHMAEILGGDFDNILFQHYGYVHTPDTEGEDLRRLDVIDTTGKTLPRNLSGSPDASQVSNSVKKRYIYVGQDNKISMHTVLMPIYAPVEFTQEMMADSVSLPDLTLMAHMDENDSQYYKSVEVWVTYDLANVDSVNRDDFEVYPYSGGLYLTLDETDESPDAICIKDQAVIRFVYEANAGSQSVTTNFYDYDITDGFVYKTQSDADNMTNQTATSTQPTDKTNIWANTKRHGINSPSNYETVQSKMMGFGNGNTASGMQDYVGNKANSTGFGGCTFGLVSHVDSNGHLVYASDVSAPKLFNDGTAEGKTAFQGYDLNFTRIGDVYTLTSVSGTSTGNLDTFVSVEKWHPSWAPPVGYIWYNNFWPMDSAPTWGADGHDLKFGSAALKSNRRLQSNNEDQSEFPGSDDGQDHNSYFGMNFELTFELKEDYVAPLSYLFFGDDDMWVFLDGQLVCDIGGVHSSVGEYVNLRDYLPEGSSGTHTLSFFYTERGASGSTCWMQFQLPHPLVSSTLPPTSEPSTGSVGLTKYVADTANLTEDAFDIRLDMTDRYGNVLTGEYMYSGDVSGSISSGGIIKLGYNQTAVISGLPVGAQVRATELLSDAQEQLWTMGAESNLAGTVSEDTVLELTVCNYYSQAYDGPRLPNTGGDGLFAAMTLGSWCVSGASGFGLIRLFRYTRPGRREED